MNTSSHIIYVDSPDELRQALEASVRHDNVVVRFTVPEISFANETNHRLNLPSNSQGITLEGPVTLRAVQLWFVGVQEPVVVRNVRVRVGAGHLGKGDAMDATYVEKCTDVTFEQCSFSHASDELVSINYCEHVRFERCLFSNPLHIPTVRNEGREFIHPEGAKGSHGYGLRSSAVQNLVLRQCIFANCHRRAPQCNNKNVREHTTYKMLVEDTIIYNYGQHGFTYNNKPDEEVETARYMVEFRNNWFIPGPRTHDSAIEIDCEEPETMQFRVWGLSSCAIARKTQMELKFRNRRFFIDSGAGLTLPYSALEQRVGCLPHDKNDDSVLAEISAAIVAPPPYDKLDATSYPQRWPESGWIHYAE